ncbi:fungal-specific transcription factor domain-domain-containing protein [Coniella lustricola]|uniref:Fungal-specific transcription factor domain-domain-containing protein n=1 Tax=Coniella lustricola TaxID=2025994 RepID=A0A2T3A8B0_9PEZI|nr:fungal-specific transcription factor domain-domain-containing protein [Coniella lustricola]
MPRASSHHGGSIGPTKGASDGLLRPVACNTCRDRRSYCSKDRPKCTRCRIGRLDCVYETARKITINEAYLRELEAKVRYYEDTGGDAAPVPVMPSSRIDSDETTDDLSLPEEFTQLSVESPGSTSIGFRGPTHSDQFLKSFGKVSRLQDDGALDQHADFYDREALPSRRFSTQSHVRLPPLDIARQLYAAQYTYIGTIFAFTDPPAFERLLQEAYQGPPDLGDQNSCLAYTKLLVILAFGKMYSVNQWIDWQGPPGFDYFTLALEFLPDMHEEGSILFVETLALVGYFMQNLNRRDAACLYVGMALRMAITLGLHQETANTELSEEVKEHRRRVWWSVYSLDRIQSVKSGNPITIHDEDIGVALPSKLPHEPEYSAAIVLRHYTKLSQICGEVTVHIYRRTPKTGSTLMASVQRIIMGLSKWHQELPEELQFDPARLSISRESVSTLLHYSQCINMTARPLLFHVVQQRCKAGLADKERDWKEGLTQTTVKVIETCVAAARDTIHMMTIAAQKNLVATYGYMDSEHAFSASIVLVMVCVAFPTDSQNINSMNAALELLCTMSKKGNSHMAARYDLLNRLRATFLPDAVPVTPEMPPATVEQRSIPIQIFDMSPNTSPVAVSLQQHEPLPLQEQTILQQQQQQQQQQQPSAAVDTTQHVPRRPAGAMLDQNSTMPLQNGLTDLQHGVYNVTNGYTMHNLSQMPDFSLLTNPSLAEGIFYDMDMAGVNNNNQDFWEEAFANPAGDPGSTLMESLDWTG